MSQVLNRFIYHLAGIPAESDPDNPTPAEKHTKAIRNMTGISRPTQVAKAFTRGW